MEPSTLRSGDGRSFVGDNNGLATGCASLASLIFRVDKVIKDARRFRHDPRLFFKMGKILAVRGGFAGGKRNEWRILLVRARFRAHKEPFEILFGYPG